MQLWKYFLFGLGGLSDILAVISTSLRLAQALMPLICLKCGIILTYRTHKAGVMPGVAQGFKKPVSSFNGEFAAMAHGTKEGIVICTTESMKHEWKCNNFP